MRSRRSLRVWRRKERGGRGPAAATVRERGTVLLMVIGVLALLAIIAVVYAAIGQADRRASSAFVRQTQVEDISSQVGDYIAGIIGQDIFQVVEDQYPGGGNAQRRLYRAHWTYPGMPIADDIFSDPPNNAVAFRPVGGSTDPERQGYQPWLAPAEPVFLRYNGNANWTDPDRQYLDFRDWSSISNVAPTGQFVNLTNLRNNFHVEPGLGADAAGRPRLAEGLTLFDQNGLVYAAGNAEIEDGNNANENIPWHWTMRQRHAARPIDNFAVGAGLPGPGENEYLRNQWADADGDGIADARWFELSGAAGPLAQYIVPGLAQQDRARYFAAVRIVDLSGMLNISTATDLLTPPGPLPDPPDSANPPAPSYPFGTTPADIDALRALMLTDVYQRYAAGPGGNSGYMLIQQPPDPRAAGNYLQYSNDQGAPAAQEIGRAAYQSLQIAIGADRVPGSPGWLYELGTNNQSNPNFDFDNPVPTSPLERARIYNNAQADPSNVGYSQLGFTGSAANPNVLVPAVITRSPFGMTEALELHAFFGANDPRQVSRLEAVIDGRRTTGANVHPTYGPLRSTRALDVERGRRGDTPPVVGGLQDNDSLAHQHFDLRHRLTTISGARPFTTVGPARSFNPRAISDAEVRVDLREFLPTDLPLTTGAVRRFFNHVADALMPYRATNTFLVNQMWDAAANPEYAPLAYGRSFDFALRAAAHLVANTIDASDNDNAVDRDVAGPTAFTLQTTVSPPSDPVRYPYDTVTLEPRNLNLGTDGRAVESQQVNIYGIEAQPFLVEVGSYAFWTDVPWDATVLGGQTDPDHEWFERDPDGPGGPQPPMDVAISIDHTVSYQNADYLGDIVAFQVTNPFDRDLYLTRTGSGGPEFLYYVEYAGRYFPLAEADHNAGSEPTFRNIDLKLKAGESRVFFATSPRHEFNFNERFNVPLSSRVTVPPGTVPDGFEFLQEFVDRQFRKNPVVDNQSEPAHTTMVDPSSWSLIAPDSNGEAGLMDLHGEDIGTTTEGRKEIRLWRVMTPDDTETPTTNIQANDMLADRIRDPERSAAIATMYQRLDSENNDDVPGTVAGDDRTSTVFGGGNPLDNTGFSVAMWGSIQRPNNPVDTTLESPLGAMPPWCIEARFDQIYTWPSPTNPVIGTGGGGPIGVGSLNREKSGPGGRGTDADYGGGDTRYTRLTNLISDLAQGDGGVKINDQMREKPEDKKGNPIPVSPSKDENDAFVNFKDKAVRIALGGTDASGVRLNPGLFKRAGDILLPLAIGPSSDLRQSEPSLRHMTLAEALAIATDYYSPPADALYHLAGHSNVPANLRPKLDAGHLVVDDFVPFNDVNGNGVYDPAAGNAKEKPIGLGIPLALNLLDKFRVNDHGGKASSEVGRVSINTSTLLTTSLLPFAAPDPRADWLIPPPAPINGRDPLYFPAVEPFDVAASIQAYRDKIDMRTRPTFTLSGAGDGRVAVPNTGATLEVGFRDTVNPFRNPWLHDGRRTRNLIPAVREEPGFRSIGELMAVALRDAPTGIDINQYRSNSIDRFAHDGVAFNGQRGVEPVNVRVFNGGVASERSDEVVDDYGEKLAIANALINTVTVRSDVFCVWFIVNGYLPSDVQNLGPNDPMVPSIARRYMMIVDRSNVVQKGDKPRVLLFNEVPM